ncbi:uncharacterized protein LOC142232420 [Haematobia irritans]|uniref:uncharacterized protein LOC142232420 n=1 Tax=Haematobia irritans TaxID=7368 RepID=UPI003F4FA2C3
MKFAVFVCVLCSLLVLNEAAIAKARFHNPTNPGKCTITTDLVLSPGQKAKAHNNPCAGVTCLDNGYAEFKTCDPVPPPKGCKLRDFVNIDRSFPECCERTYDCSKQI